jgi:hypothetical protein
MIQIKPATARKRNEQRGQNYYRIIDQMNEDNLEDLQRDLDEATTGLSRPNLRMMMTT